LWPFFPALDWLGNNRIVARISTGAEGVSSSVNPLYESPAPNPTPMLFISKASSVRTQTLSDPARVLRIYGAKLSVIDLNTRVLTTIEQGRIGEFSTSPDASRVVYTRIT